MTPRYTRRARRHLEAIAEYIAERNPRAAQRVGERIREATSLLGDMPYIGREGVLTGTREFVVPGLPYVVVYRVEAVEQETVVILGVYHGAQLRRAPTSPVQGECPARGLLEEPRWPLATLASAAGQERR